MSDWSGTPPPRPPSGPPSVPAGAGTRPLPLRPMGVGELLDGAIKLYRRKWATLMAMVAILYVPLTFIQAFVTQSLVSPFEQAAIDPTFAASEQFDAFQTTLITFGAVTVGFVLLTFLFVQPFVTAAMARAASRLYLGEDVGIGPTYRFAIGRVHSILWISILTFLAVLLVFLPVILLLVAVIGTAAGGGDPGGAAVLLLLVFLLAFVAAVFIFVRLVFGSTVLVIEGLKGTKALGRSWRLVKGKFWRVLGTLTLAGLVAFVVALVISLPLQAAFEAIGPEAWPLAALSDALATVITTPFTILIAVLLYFDLRIRKEGFDLEVMARELGSEP